MSTGAEDYEVGYGRPPLASRWKPGQTGNPKRIRARAARTTAQIIDDAFADEVPIDERRMSVFEVFLRILDGKAAAGETRAAAVLRQYRRYARECDGGGTVTEVRVVDYDHPLFGTTHYE